MTIEQDRADALTIARIEIDNIDNDIIDLLMRRMVKARHARYLHPASAGDLEYVDDYDRELAVLVRYSKRLMPWVSSSEVHELCSALFRMSRPS